MSAETGSEPIPEPYLMQGILHRELIKATNERDEARNCLQEAIEITKYRIDKIELVLSRWRKAAGMEEVK
jgi:hypothetical protein